VTSTVLPHALIDDGQVTNDLFTRTLTVGVAACARRMALDKERVRDEAVRPVVDSDSHSQMAKSSVLLFISRPVDVADTVGLCRLLFPTIPQEDVEAQQ
jgi:hypothetical protein